MSYQSIPLQAGIPFRLDIAGKLILIDSTGAAGGVDLALVRNGTPGPTMPNRKAAFRHVGQFDGVILTAAVDTVCALFLSFDDVQLGVADGSAMRIPDGVKITNAPDNPVAVNFAGTVAPVLGVITNTPAQAIPVTLHGSDDATNIPTIPYQAQAVTDPAPVAVAAAAGVIVAASAARRGLRIKNAGGNPVAIGGAGVTFANAAIVLQPGETWNETEAPGAAWYSICAATLNSTLNLQTIA